MPSASVPVWARQWQKFFIERIGIDSLHLGLLLLMLILLLILFLSIMSLILQFCCCTRRPRHRKCSATETPKTVPNRISSNGGFFSGTNEERRCLLPSNGICRTETQQQKTKTMSNSSTIDAEDDNNKKQQREGQAVAGTAGDVVTVQEPPQTAENITIVVESTTQPKCQPCSTTTASTTPLMAQRGQLLSHRSAANFPAESPPLPRRFGTGGRTQVLPLTSQNCRRVPPLVMLMADQQQQQMARGRMAMATILDSRATTTTTITNGTMKNCATILEDPEEANRPSLSDELLSIDRTFVSTGDEQSQHDAVMGRVAHRLPLQQPAPKFEVPPPSYSPPEPPNNKMMMTINICRESTNFSRCSYGGAQTPLNTTTGSSAEPSVDSMLLISNKDAEIRISELESETNADAVNCANAAQLAPPGNAVPMLSQRVPRSISQQLELMNMNQQS